MALGKNIKRIREARGISVAELSRRSGVPDKSLYAIEARDSERSEFTADIAAGLGVSADMLLGKVTAAHLEDMTSGAPKRTKAPAIETDGVSVPKLDVWGSMGIGAPRPDHEEVIETMTVSGTWLRRVVSCSSPKNLALISAFGDSMEGTFSDGDVLLVDRGVADIKVDAVYVLSLRDELYVKRLQRRPDGSVLMISDNRKYEPYLIQNGEREKFEVLGRVVWSWNGRRM